MNILLLHNYYQQPGGEDQVLALERHLLRLHGHSVLDYTVHNDEVSNLTKYQLASKTVWNTNTYRTIRDLIQREAPEILHIHNTFPLISPSVYYAAKREGVPVVQTLHNFRLICPNAMLFRNGRVCEDCLRERIPWPSIVHSCYRNDRIATAGVVTMLSIHRSVGTWVSAVNVYIALSMFARKKFIEGGIPANKIVVKSNFVSPDPGQGKGGGGYALFAGRLSPEKGLETLMDAWRQLGGEPRLKIVGNGPLDEQILAFSSTVAGVEWLGRRSRDEVLELMKNAMILIFPSYCYEGIPLTILEAFAVGLPVLGSQQGSAGEIIDDGRTGLHFVVGDANDLIKKVKWVIKNPETLKSMARNAREEFVKKYTAQQNYQELMSIYHKTIQQAKSKLPGSFDSGTC